MEEIRELIDRLFENCPALETDLTLLSSSLGRVVADSIASQIDLPHYDESLRDGFALHKDFIVAEDGSACFVINGEIAAGDRGDGQLRPQQVCRIMTGAQVPGCCIRVIPKELGHVLDDSVYFSAEALKMRRDFIKPRGCETKSGELMIPRGMVVSASHIGRLAAAGVEDLVVYQRPKVCFFCTGKELVASKEQLKADKKISSNHHMLAALIHKFGCDHYDLGILEDDLGSLKKLLVSIDLSKYAMVMSTGGTGRGRYDLIERALRESGGKVYCTSLKMRPGKSLVLGALRGAVYCGLPGPPAAVETLFHEIVAPVLLKMQGVACAWPETVQAYLKQDIGGIFSDVVHIKGGIFAMHGGKCWVRIAKPGEYATCNLILPPHRDPPVKGELVEVHLQLSPFAY